MINHMYVDITYIIFRVVKICSRDGGGANGFVCVRVNLDLRHIFDQIVLVGGRPTRNTFVYLFVLVCFCVFSITLNGVQKLHMVMCMVCVVFVYTSMCLCVCLGAGATRSLCLNMFSR